MLKSNPSKRPVTLFEVGPRDGLQNHPRPFSVEERIAFINKCAEAGLRNVEAVSFVNDKKAPRMANPEAVLAGIQRPSGLHLAGLVLNARGVERALGCDLQELRFVLIASETFSQRNQGAAIAQNVATFADVAPTIKRSGRRLTAVIAASFGCPFEGVVPQERVLDLVDAAVQAGADEVILADTIGSGTPDEVKSLVAKALPRLNGRRLGCHFHNTRNMGYANAYVALEQGATILDAALGGMGGCPFAPRATGNIATEDLSFLLRQMGIETGVRLPVLLEAVEWLQSLLTETLPGQVSRAGLFPEIASAS